MQQSSSFIISADFDLNQVVSGDSPGPGTNLADGFWLPLSLQDVRLIIMKGPHFLSIHIIISFLGTIHKRRHAFKEGRELSKI